MLMSGEVTDLTKLFDCRPQTQAVVCRLQDNLISLQFRSPNLDMLGISLRLLLNSICHFGHKTSLYKARYRPNNGLKWRRGCLV
jgi:hypothetical protein